MKTSVFAVSAFASIFASSVNAQAFTEHVFDEIPLGSPIFDVDCIAVAVTAPLTALALNQTTVTPSGRLHHHENWRVYGIWTSSDGYEWSAYGQWPESTNLLLTENKQVAVRGKLKIIASPIEDNPYPRLETSLQYKFMQDANGNVIIDRFSDSPPDCLGKNP